MSYRPITDFWLLARAKLKGGKTWYGAYLGGFPERARVLLGVTFEQPVLHVCGGMARHYPYAGGFGPNDKTVDLDPICQPDYLRDVRDPLPMGFAAMLLDPPYSLADAEKYHRGADVYPSPGKLVQNAIDALEVGQRVGIIHYMVPRRPPNSRVVAIVGVNAGNNNRIRAYTVFEKVASPIKSKQQRKR
jgi:hypothetical protein